MLETDWAVCTGQSVAGSQMAVVVVAESQFAVDMIATVAGQVDNQ